MATKLLCGNSLDVLKTLDTNSIDACVTDPPYELGFMGKKWDNTGIAYNETLWGEVIRVLKPGGHLLSFGGSRTYHRMACAIEDAGFEIRDQIMYVYGQGFPKSLNIGKAVDKLQGNERKDMGMVEPVGREGRKTAGKAKFGVDGWETQPLVHKTIGHSEWEGYGTALKPAHEIIAVAQKPLTAVPLCDILSMVIKTIGGSLCQLPLFVRIAEKSLPSNLREQLGVVGIVQWLADKNTNTRASLSVLMAMLQLASKENTNWNIVSLWLNTLSDLYKMESKFTTSTKNGMITELKILNSLAWQDIFQNITNLPEKKTDGLNVNALTAANLFNAARLKLNYILTHSAQDPAIFKDALADLRPKHNPIVLARKPLSEKTVAQNVLRWGTGGLNIDGCRVEGKPRTTHKDRNYTGNKEGQFLGKGLGKYEAELPQGRFPANLITDGSDEVTDLFPQTKSGALNAGHKRGDGTGNSFMGGGGIVKGNYGNDSGSAARFFYCAKASKRERDMGCGDIEPKYGIRSNAPRANEEIKTKTKTNNHPTVKPLALMKYLIKLVTREGQTVLDPFLGSGTTGMAAKELGRDFIGIELNQEYIDIANNRIAAIQKAPA